MAVTIKHKEKEVLENQKERIDSFRTSESLPFIKPSLVILSPLIIVIFIKQYMPFLTFWNKPRDVLQQYWSSLLDLCEHDSYTLTTVLSVSHFVFFWTIGGMYTVIDVTGWPKFLTKHKVQPGKNEPVEKKILLKAIAVANFNLLVTSYPFMIIWFKLMELRGFDKSPQLPSLEIVIRDFYICIIFQEVYFYYAHRLFHISYFYNNFHKIHHTWQAPIAIAAVYAHPLEHFIANLGAVYIGPLLLGSHCLTWWIFVVYSLFLTLSDHSNYHFPFMLSPEMHDYHHSKFNECYASYGIMDYLHGTDKRFRASSSFVGHKMLFSLIPARFSFSQTNNEEKKKDI